MNASIGEPFAFAQYQVPTGNREGGDYVNAHSCVPENGNSSVTLTVPGEGVHVIDLASLHPISFLTSVAGKSYSSRAISRLEVTANAQPIRAIYVPWHSSSQDGTDSCDFALSKWEQVISDPLDSVAELKSTAKMPAKIDSLCYSNDLSTHMFVFLESGETISVDSRLNHVASRKLKEIPTRRLHTSVLSPQARKFAVPSQIHKDAIIIASILQHQERYGLYLHTVTESGTNITSLEVLPLTVDEPLLHASFEPSGTLTLLTAGGRCVLTSIFCRGTRLKLKSQQNVVSLKLGTFASMSYGRPVHPEHRISVLSLTSAHVLMAGLLLASPPIIQLQMWDLQYSVILSSASSPLPAFLSAEDVEQLRIQLVTATAEQCLLLISPSSQNRSHEPVRSVVLGLPFSFPAASTVAVAIGGFKATADWLLQLPEGDLKQSEKARQALLRDISSCLGQRDGPKACETFFNWWESESKGNEPASKISFASVRYGRSKKRLVASTSSPRHQRKSAIMPYQFTSDLLALILQHGHDEGDCSKILAFLFRKRLVSQGMVESGVSNALLKLENWKSVDIALKHMFDISEDDLAAILYAAVANRRRDDNDMQVDDSDKPSQASSIPRILASILRYPTSPAPMCNALRRHFKDVNDIICVMEVLDTWFDAWKGRSLRLASVFEITAEKIEAGDAYFEKRLRSRENKAEMPSLEQIISFTETLLDGFFVPLVHSTVGQPVLKRIQGHAYSLISFIQRLQHLRGPLESFTREHRLLKSLEAGGEATLAGSRRTMETQNLSLHLYQIEDIDF